MKQQMNRPARSKINWTALLMACVGLAVALGYVPPAAQGPLTEITLIVGSVLIAGFRTWFTEPPAARTRHVAFADRSGFWLTVRLALAAVLVVLAVAALIWFLTAFRVVADATVQSLDKFDLTQIDKHTAELTYHNSATMSSAGFPPSMEGEGFTVDLHLKITGGDEILTVTPSEGWVAIPERISVADGDEGTITIIEILGF